MPKVASWIRSRDFTAAENVCRSKESRLEAELSASERVRVVRANPNTAPTSLREVPQGPCRLIRRTVERHGPSSAGISRHCGAVR